MGIQVDFGTELGLVDFGDMPEQEVVATLRSQGERIRSNLIARRQAELSSEPVPDMVRDEALQSGRLASAGQSFMRGGGEAAGKSTSFLARLGEMLARSGTIIGPGGAIPMTDPELLRQQVEQVDDTAIEREQRVQQDSLYQLGRQITEGSREAFQPNPAYEGEFLTSTIPGSAGGMVPTIASSMAGGPVLAALQYGGAAGQSAAEEAIAAGRPDLAQTAAMVNAPIGAVTEAILGPAANIAKYARLAGGGAGKALLRGGAGEAVQETIEQGGSNVAARAVGYDPERPLLENVPESAAAGFFLGGLAGGGAAGARKVGQRVQQGLQDRLAPDFSLTPPPDQNPLTPPPEWFNRQAEVQQAATVAIQSLDQQIAQANPQTPLEANVLVAQNAAQKMEVLNQYLEAQRNLAQQAAAAVAQQAPSTEPQYQPFPPIAGDQLPLSASAVQAAAPLAALEAQQAATFPVAPMAQAAEPAPALLNQSVIDQLRAARQQDELARADVQAASTLPETAAESTPVDQFILNRQPATQDALFVASSDESVLRPEASQPELQVGLPQVGQGDAQVPAAGQVQEEAVAPKSPKGFKPYLDEYGDPVYRWRPSGVDPNNPPSGVTTSDADWVSQGGGRYMWRSMGEGEYAKLIAGKQSYGGRSARKGNYLASYPEKSSRFANDGNYMVEFAGAKPAGETSSKKLTLENVTAVWRRVGDQWEPVEFNQNQPKTQVAEKEKTDFDARRVKWAESPVIQGLNDLTPAEASRVVDEANGVEPTTPPTSKTELARFIREARQHIDSGAGGLAEDIRPAAFQAERNRLMDAVMRDVIRNFESDGGPDAWRYDFAWKRAFVPIDGKAVVKREMYDIRRTERFADLKTQVPTEVTTEEGDTVSTIDKPELQKQQSPAELLSDSISVFVANNNLSDEDAIALKLRVAKERNPDLYEEHVSGLDEDQAAETREMVDSPRTTQLYRKLPPSIREYLSSISGPITVAMDKASVEQTLASAFGSLPNLTVIEDPTHTLPNGQSGRNVAAYINLPTGQITVNAAYIDTPARAVEAVLEEGVHSVWDLPEIQAAWAVVKAAVTKAKLDAQIARGYSPEVALEEAAVADVLAYLKENKVGGPIEKFLTTLWSRLKALFGIGNQYDQSRNQILQKALEALQGSRAVTAQQDAEYMAAVEAGDTATAQRMVDEAAKRAGYTRKLWHGTSATEDVVTEGSDINRSAMVKLTQLAAKYGISEDRASDAPAILERLARTPASGVNSEDAILARQLLTEARSTYKPESRQERLAFSVFRLPAGELELGVHLGTRQQAGTFGQAFPFWVKLESPKRLPDLAVWDWQTVIRELRKRGVPISDGEYNAVASTEVKGRNSALRELLGRRGVKSIVYRNEAEGAGDSYIALSENQIKSADPVTRDDLGNLIPLSRRFSEESRDIRFSRNNGVFLSRTQAQSAISQAQEVGGDVSTLAQVAQVEGELVPRQTVADVEALASSQSKVERIAARFLAPLKSIGDLADQTWLAPFTRFSPTARSASEAGSAAELAAEAVVRADLALKAKAKAVKERLAKAEMDLLEAVDNLPRAVAADSDAQINKAEGEALISEMEKALANELTAARAVDVPDAEIQASILRASRILSEARKDIGSGIGSALTAIARELPAQITDEAAILNWVEQRLNNKSLPPLMSEAVRSFLTTPLYKARTAPIQRIQLAPLIKKLRAITATKEAAKAELEQFKKDFHQGRVSKSGKPLNVSVKAFAKRFAGFEEKYKAALALSREINAKVSRAQDYVDALRLADEKFTETFKLPDYRQKLEDAVNISNAGSGSLKILIGDDGQLNGTVSIPNPLTKKIEVVDLSPLAFKRQETQAKLNELALLHEQALTDPETDPYDRIQLARNLTQIQRMQDAGLRSATNLVDMIPESVPFFGGMTYIPMSRLHHDAPWFGKRLSAPNNVVTWVSGAAGKQVAGIMAATDIAAAQLERLRSDSDPSKPSQTKINDLTVTSMKAHDMDPQNAENQSRIASHFSEIISQAQRPEQRPFRVGDTNPVTNLPVLKEDIAAVEAMKQWGTAVYKVGQRAKPDSIARNIAERPVQQTEVISGKSISRIAADYGLKLPRQADVSKLPIVRDWVNATEPQKLVILEENFPTIVTGMVTETDPDFTSRFDAVDRKVFNEAMLLGRAGNLPFQDVDSFLTWWATARAAETGLTPTEELAEAQKNLLKYVDGFMRVFGEYAGVGQKSELTTADREVRNTPDSLMTIATADNQFTRPRGTLLAPSTFYSYDLTGIGAQEGLKTNLLNVFHHEHIKAWINVKSALKAAMETFDRKKREMVAKGMSESKARRILQAESRKKSASIANEADYATIRNVVGHIEAMVSEMTRVATERLSVPEDAPLMRSGKAAVGLSGAVLLQSSAAIINNATGGAYGSAVIDSWLNRTHGLAAGPQALAALTKNAFARIVGTAGRKVGWFGKWLQSNGAVANALADMVAEATYRRQLAEDALTVDAPDTKAMIKARLALPGSGGVVDPGRTDPIFSRILNQLQSGMGIPEIKRGVPTYLHPMVDALATGATALPEYTKRLFPSAVDRMINTTTGYMYRTWVEDPAIKKALFDHWSRKEALGGNWDSPSNPDFQFSNDDIGDALPSQSRKLLSDILAPIGSLERLSLAWYNRTKGMTPAERAAEPILTKDQADQVEFEFLKLTNQRAESTTPQVMKGKGLGGLVRSIFWQFARYGANHTAVIQRRFAKLSGGQDDENKWLAGLCLALVLALLGATGLELKGIMKIFEGDARTTPTLAQAGTDPEAALRYMAASITPFLHPTGTEVVQSLVGGQTQTTPFDITQKVPVLGQATAFAKAAKTAWQTGDIGYPAADFLRNALPISKFVINALMPGDAARREAARAVRAAAPSDIELREFAGGLGGRATPMTPLIRDAINSAMEGDTAGYNEAVERAVAYQMSTGKDRKAALKSVESVIAAKDPIQSVVGRTLTPQDENRLLSRMSTKQRRSFLRARSITSGIRSKRSLLGRSRKPRSLLRQRRKKTKRTRLA